MTFEAYVTDMLQPQSNGGQGLSLTEAVYLARANASQLVDVPLDIPAGVAAIFRSVCANG
jgi:hypothetical protein